MTHLPDEILFMICTQVWHQRDFNTLFNCACSGRRLAIIAVKNLYSTQDLDPLICTDDDNDGDFNCSSNQEVATPDGQESKAHAHAMLQERTLMKRARIWRTIIRSSLGRTLFPYSQFIRTLDLRDLEELLIRLQLDYRATAGRDFFQDELAQFEVDINSYDQRGGNIGTMESISRIGEAITNQAPLLEVLIGTKYLKTDSTYRTVFRRALSQWIPRLPRLTYLAHWHGAALSKENGTLIRLHCPSFKGLDLSHWSGDNDEPRDQNVAAFLNEIRPHSLQSFETFNLHDNERETFQALNYHGKSLTVLNLYLCQFLSSNTIPNFSLLNGCTNLVSLSLAEIQTYDSDLDVLCHDRFHEIFGWLKECKKLRNLASFCFFRPVWIEPIFLENSICLTSFEYEGFQLRDTKNFHQALAHQTSLQYLWLKGDKSEFDEDEFDVEADVIVESLSKLINLKDLHVEGISSVFVDRHFVQLAGNLPQLKSWSTNGGRLTDAIWEEVASLRSLQELTIRASTNCFTTQSIVVFIEKLGAGNKGLVLSVTDTGHSFVDQDLIHKEIAKKVEGRFKFSPGD